MTTTTKYSILTVNGGSSSIKFSAFEIEDTPTQIFHGQIENIGTQNARLTHTNSITRETEVYTIEAPDYASAANILADHLIKQKNSILIKAIGHRIVNGMAHTEPEEITDELIKELKAIITYDPDHLPGEIALIEIFRKQYPVAKHIACFDTSFHATMPQVATWISIPRKYHAKGIRRYGFHGLSYAYLIDELKQLSGEATANGRIIIAHLGNGASLAAIKNGKSQDTSMGFTPTSGLPMSTRSGDLDPGVALYLMEVDKLNPKEFNKLINHESGLLGISELSSDMRELLRHQHDNKSASEAIELFCYQAKKWIGSFAAVLGGVDTLIFSGGIGENAPEVRTRICEGLQFLGIEVSEEKNNKNETIISPKDSAVSVRVMKTNEELMIARLVFMVLNYTVK